MDSRAAPVAGTSRGPDLSLQALPATARSSPLSPGPRRWLRCRSGQRLAPFVALLSLTLYTAAAVARFGSTWAAPTRRAICGCGDAALSMWFLRWEPYAVLHGQSPFFSSWINVPDGVNTMWNVSFILPALLLAPVTILGGAVLTYNVLSVAGFALSAYSACLVFRRWAPWWPAAFAGALLFGFSPFMTAQGLGHLHMTLALLIPVFLLALDELLVRQRGRAVLWGALLGVAAAAQLLTAEELLASAGLIGLLGVLVLLALDPKRVRLRAPYALRGLAAALVVFLALAAWPLYAQLAGSQRLSGPVQQSETYSSDLLAPVVPGRLMHFTSPRLLETFTHFTGNTAEKGGYLGLPLLLILLGVVVLYRRLPVVRFAALMLVATFVLSLGRHLHVAGRTTDVVLPLSLLRRLPFLQSVIASRLALYVTLFAGLLLAVGLDRLHASVRRTRERDVPASNRLRRAWSVAVPLALAVAAMVPILPAGSYPVGDAASPGWFTSAALHRVPSGSVVLTVPVPSRADSRPMLWQATADMRYRSPGGYVLVPDDHGAPRWGGTPAATEGILHRLASGQPIPPLAATVRELRADLVRWAVRTVVIPLRGMPNYAAAVRLYTAVLGRPPLRDGGVFVWYDVIPARLVS